MASAMSDSDHHPSRWKPAQAYVMAAICLFVGVLIGYLFRGSAGVNPPAPPQAAAESGSGPAMGQQMPTLEQMKHMADKKAEPLLQQLKTKPNDVALLVQIADLYKSAHQFREAAGYYAKSLSIDPRNAGVRTDMASCLYYAGDVDTAISELEKSLQYDPKYAGALFNLGMVRWKGKMDAPAAIAAWEQLLKVHPELQNKAGVEKLIAEARQHLNVK